MDVIMGEIIIGGKIFVCKVCIGGIGFNGVRFCRGLFKLGGKV